MATVSPYFTPQGTAAQEAGAGSAIKGSDSQIDSGLSLSADLLADAQLSNEEFLEIAKVQSAFKQAVKEKLPRSQDGRRIFYSYPVTLESPIPSRMDILPKELEGTEHKPEFPAQFTKDYVDVRSPYMLMYFPGQPAPIRVTNPADTQKLIQASRQFARSISGSQSPAAQEKLERVVMLSVSQILPNFVFGPVILDQQMKRAESGAIGSQFKTDIQEVKIRLTPVEGWFFTQECQFHVDLKVTVTTAHKVLTAKGITEEQAAARQALGITPIL